MTQRRNSKERRNCSPLETERRELEAAISKPSFRLGTVSWHCIPKERERKSAKIYKLIYLPCLWLSMPNIISLVSSPPDSHVTMNSVFPFAVFAHLPREADRLRRGFEGKTIHGILQTISMKTGAVASSQRRNASSDCCIFAFAVICILFGIFFWSRFRQCIF